ncbi:MAG: hypothetical protein ACM3JD_09385 [Rudaea sp.]
MVDKKNLIWLALLFLVACAQTPVTPTAKNTTEAIIVRTRTPLPTSTPVTPQPTALPTVVSATRTHAPAPPPQATDLPTETAAITPTATITPTPPPLPLRDDLPPLTLKDWPRPENDNGLGIHFIATGYYDAAELDREIARMQSLHLKWALVLYADENHLQLAATKFKAAGITVVWRKTLRPFQRYLSWGRDIDILNRIGMPPYMQLYNEPELPFEWENQPVDPDLYMENLLQAAKDVYNAGGYPGIQFLDDDNLRQFITQIYARQGEPLFHRMFFVAHAYGLNHPPDYAQDSNGVLGFVIFAQIMQRRLGFIPPIIVGEGGWKVGSQEDTRFPPVDETRHRDYTLAVFNWFRTGVMSNGNPLPDYLFAFCPWMLAGSDEAGAWYDAFNGNRTLTIAAVQAIPAFVRKFSWQR